jgi:GNAT superfamily N-acetyltransferase
MNYTISTDKTKLDVPAIHDYLCNRSYWAKGISLADVQKSIDHTMCFGLYDEAEKMLGFARVLTDHVAFMYLMDVFVLEDYRGQGLGKMLVQHIVEHPELQVRRQLLATVDAHGLYRKLGFAELEEPGRYLTRKKETHA